MNQQLPFQFNIDDFDYSLPENKIATEPLANRHDSKLLVYKNGIIQESLFQNVTDFLPNNSVLVFNNTKVNKARLKFKNANGKTIEVFCLEPANGVEINLAMNTSRQINWNCLVGNLKQWKEDFLTINKEGIELKVEIGGRNQGHLNLTFNWNPKDLTFAEILEHFGEVPIPPYLKRESNSSDVERYQTIYAANQGSVAAPTAGLHFTNEVLDKLTKKSIQQVHLTLHVGAGTFKPIKGNSIAEHEMHKEQIEVTSDLLLKLIEHSHQKTICVGTTSLRTLETIYWMGLKAYYQSELSLSELEVKQWDPYLLKLNLISKQESYKALLNWMRLTKMERVVCNTQILIAPPYKVKTVDGIITNFHQPKSTLLLLVNALVGDKWKDIYHYALSNNFRFLSYGDSSLLL